MFLKFNATLKQAVVLQNPRVTFWCCGLMMIGLLLTSSDWCIFVLSLTVCVCVCVCVSACLQSQAEKMLHVLVHPCNLHLDTLSIFFAWLLWVPSTLPTQSLKAPRIDLSRLKHRNRVAPGKRRLGRSGQKTAAKNISIKHFPSFFNIAKKIKSPCKEKPSYRTTTIEIIINNQPFPFLSTAPGRFPGPRRDVRAPWRPPWPPRPRWEALGRAGRCRRGQPWRRCGSRWWWNLGGWDLDKVRDFKMLHDVTVSRLTIRNTKCKQNRLTV